MRYPMMLLIFCLFMSPAGAWVYENPMADSPVLSWIIAGILVGAGFFSGWQFHKKILRARYGAAGYIAEGPGD